jgi:hypothetical protein
MAQNKTYTELLALIQALAGVDSFTTSEQTKILAMANRRLYQAYNASPVWPRYVVGAEARPANDGLIEPEFTASTFGVSSATRSGSVVTIVCTGDVDFVAGMYVTVSGLTGSTDPNGTYIATSVDDATFEYNLTSGTGSETYTGSGSVIPVAVSDVATFNRVWDGNPYAYNTTAVEYEFWVDADGAHVVGGADGLAAAWVHYKKEWPGPYLVSATDIPLEFFYYAAHATYADFLRMDGQTDKAMAEEAAAQTYLVLELEKAETQRNNNLLYRRISTHNSRQAR